MFFSFTSKKIVISLLSGEFAKNKLCRNLFQLAKITLRKKLVLVRVDKDYTESPLGLQTAGEVINSFLFNTYKLS